MAKKAAKKTQTIEKAFSFKLTRDDEAKYGRQMAEYDADIEKLEGELESTKKEFNGRIGAIEKERRKISEVIRAGEESRTVKATMEYDYDAGLVRYFYKGQELERRPMEPGERQMDLAVAKTTKRGRDKKAAKDEEKKPAAVAGDENDLRKVIREETSKVSKHSAVDGARPN